MENKNSKNAICTIAEVTKRHRSSTLLGPLSFSLFRGEILGLQGANGAGKSTLLKTIAGLYRPTSGRIQFDSNEPLQIGYVPQDIALYMELSGRENLRFWAGVYGLSKQQYEIRIPWLLKAVNLEEKAEQLLQTYSGGMCRRLNLAVALLKTPAILLLDEPTVGADYESVETILNLMKDLKSREVSIIFVSHQEEELRKVSDRILTLADGKIQSISERSQWL